MERSSPRESELVASLLSAYQSSPYPSFKVNTYFPVYASLFGHLVGTDCTFIETGILNGGSLFMWRSWLGPNARIIGVDLNPNARRWEEHGFEIVIGDQGDPRFWQETFSQTGPFDVLLDDGGHQSFQQIVMLTESIPWVKPEGMIVIEDTCCSLMHEFSQRHGDRSFLEYAKDSTDLLTARMTGLFEGQFPGTRNEKVTRDFAKIHSISFFTGIVAFKASSWTEDEPELIWNRHPTSMERDFRYDGVTNSANVDWPHLFTPTPVTVHGAADDPR